MAIYSVRVAWEERGVYRTAFYHREAESLEDLDKMVNKDYQSYLKPAKTDINMSYILGTSIAEGFPSGVSIDDSMLVGDKKVNGLIYILTEEGGEELCVVENGKCVGFSDWKCWSDNPQDYMI